MEGSQSVRICLISSQALKQHLECYLSQAGASFRSHRLVYFVFSKIEIEIYFQRPEDYSSPKFMIELRVERISSPHYYKATVNDKMKVSVKFYVFCQYSLFLVKVTLYRDYLSNILGLNHI